MFEEEALMEDITEDAKANGESIIKEECKERAKNKGAALELIKSSKWKVPLEDVRTQFLYKNDVYPNDLTEAFKLLEHYAKKGGKKSSKKNKQDGTDPTPKSDEIIQGVQYANVSSTRNKGEADNSETITCFYC